MCLQKQASLYHWDVEDIEVTAAALKGLFKQTLHSQNAIYF